MRAAAPAPSPLSDHAEVERLLEASLLRRAHPLARRERVAQLGFLALFALGAGALATTGAAAPQVGLLAAGVVLAYAVASRVDYPVATGVAVPTQLFLVALFAHADARVVPLLAFAALGLGTVAACLLGRSRWDRLTATGGDALHVLGPASVLVATGHADATTAPWWVLGAAFAAQCGTELAASTVRDRLISGVAPRMQPRILAPVWALDAALTPVGIFAVAATVPTEWATFALLGLVALVAQTARDRTERTDRLRVRLEDLQRERRRLRTAVTRIGDAFASNLDLDAVVQIVGRVSVDALDVDAGRTQTVAATALVTRTVLAGDPSLEGLLDRAERGVLAARGPVHIGRDGVHALAVPVGRDDAPVAVVSLARRGAPFTAEERDLIAYLCERASVAAANVSTHETLHRQALTDDLTGLANHRRLQELLESAVATAVRDGSDVSLLLFDLDDFKRVNDTYGHQVGDLVLRAVGRCLRTFCRSGDEPARYGGEELAVVLAGADIEQATGLAERLRRELEALTIRTGDGLELSVTVSIGAAGLSARIPTKTALIDAADHALYEAKRQGKNRVHAATSRPLGAAGARRFPPRLGEDVEADLRRGLRADELQLHYQPKVTLPDRRPVGVEALVRWRHPELGLLGPAQFLPRLEGGPAMRELTDWILERAVRQAVAWRQADIDLPVAVNVSPQDLLDPGFPTATRRMLARVGARPGDLRLEVTEHMAMQDADRAQAALTELRGIGVSSSLDDFGTGHSSLTRLRDLPVDELKLDRGFLRFGEAACDVAVMQSAISLGHALGLEVIGEGVEDSEHLELLARLGCDLAQGFFIAPPLLPIELERWLGEQRALSAA